jgi:hypothetical protein
MRSKILLLVFAACWTCALPAADLHLNALDYFETQGLSVLAYQNRFHDVFRYLAVQMDHVKVRESYRVWHGVSHMDDARQAPVNYTHFDGYSMGASSDSPFAAGEHIPGSIAVVGMTPETTTCALRPRRG